MTEKNNILQSIVVEGVRDLQAYQPGKPESELKRELGLTSIIKLASNENPLGCSQMVKLGLAQNVVDATLMSTYPDGSGHGLKQSLSAFLTKQSAAGNEIMPGQITLGSGSNDLLDIIVRTFADSNSEVIMSQYAFAVYYISSKAVGAKPVVVPAAADFGHDLDAMLAGITEKTKIIFIANPNNPTGNWLTYDKLTQFLDKVPENIIVVMDEAYTEYITEINSDIEGYRSLMDDVSRYANLIVTRTFSKIYGLAALRVGYAVSSEEIAGYLNRVRHPFNVNTFAQIAAISALKDQSFVRQSAALNAKQRLVWQSALEEMNIQYIPGAGNFITAYFPGTAERLYQYLLKRGIIVRTLVPYQMPDYLRITIGNADQNRQAIALIKEFQTVAVS